MSYEQFVTVTHHPHRRKKRKLRINGERFFFLVNPHIETITAHDTNNEGLSTTRTVRGGWVGLLKISKKSGKRVKAFFDAPFFKGQVTVVQITDQHMDDEGRSNHHYFPNAYVQFKRVDDAGSYIFDVFADHKVPL